jgi:hypothetical protein
MKNTILATLAVVATSVCALGQNKDNDKQKDFHLDKEYTLSPTGTIDLSSSDAKVFITGSKRTTAHVKIDWSVNAKGYVSNRNFHVDVTEENGNLRIQEQKSSVNVTVVGVYIETYRIEIEAPEGASLKVRGDDGTYFIKNVNGAIEVHADDADVELAGCKGDKFRFRMDDGDIRMDQGRGTLDIEGDDSDAHIYNAAFTNVEASIDDGDLIIETSLDDKGNYSFRSEDGTIVLTVTKGGGEFSVRHDDTHIATLGEFKKLEDHEKFSRYALADGVAKVDIRAEDGRIKLVHAPR